MDVENKEKRQRVQQPWHSQWLAHTEECVIANVSKSGHTASEIFPVLANVITFDHPDDKGQNARGASVCHLAQTRGIPYMAT